MTDSAPARPMFGRVVVKLSGEALMGPDAFGLNAPTVQRIAADLKAAADLGVQVAVVVGGGNFFRGLLGADKGIERARADSIGMLATVMNALAMEGALEQIGQPRARPFRGGDAFAVPALFAPGGARPSRQASRHHARRRHRQPVLHHRHRRGAARRRTLLRRGDEGDAGRRRLLGRPQEGPQRDALRRLSHDEAIARNLQIMDTAAFALARDNRIPIVVFSINEPGAIRAALLGQGRATYVMP